MHISESIKSGPRGPVATADSSDRVERKKNLANWRTLLIFLSMLGILLLLSRHFNHQASQLHSLTESSIVAFSANLPDPAEQPARITVFRAESAAKLINELKKNHLWEIKAGNSVTPLLLAAYPSDLDTLSISLKKKAFLHSLLPAALMANAEIAKERETLLSIIAKIPIPFSNFTFSGLQKSWQKFVDKDEINFLKGLTRKYRTRRPEKLLKRVNVIPVSLILAQGALESSWGTSRFTKEGNSLFGLWTWRENGLVPINRDEGKNHKVEAYDSIFASLSKYTLTLNRLDAYADFRTIRTKSFDPYDLAEGLQLYSERGMDYVNDIKKVISSNDLTDFDEVQFPDIQVTMLPPATSHTSDDRIAQL